MADSPQDTDQNPFLPKGLKVRGIVPDPLSKTPTPDTNPPQQTGPSWPTVDRRKPIPQLPTQPVEMTKQGFRPMPILSIVTVLCLAILWVLGSWQWDKFESKSVAPTQTTSTFPATATVSAALEAPNPEYRPVVVDGLIDSRIIKISAVQNAVRGYRIFSPVVLEAGGIFVDRGFVAEDQLNRIVVMSGQVSLQGVLRLGARPNSYTPDNDPTGDVWYWPDLPAMASALNIASIDTAKAAPSGGTGYYVSLTQVDPLGTGEVIVNPYADNKGANQIPAERHLGYALTWWGFGLALIGVYIGMHVRAGRLRLKRAQTS